MCGINGIFHFQSQRKVDSKILTKMRDSMDHRGPDDKGLFVKNNVGLGHRRLSILDVSAAGHQPFSSDDERFVMVYNEGGSMSWFTQELRMASSHNHKSLRHSVLISSSCITIIVLASIVPTHQHQ